MMRIVIGLVSVFFFCSPFRAVFGQVPDNILPFTTVLDGVTPPGVVFTSDSGSSVVLTTKGKVRFSNNFGSDWYTPYLPHPEDSPYIVDVAVSGDGNVFYAVSCDCVYQGSGLNLQDAWSIINNDNVTSSYYNLDIATDFTGNALFISGSFNINSKLYNGIYSSNIQNGEFVALSGLPVACKFIALDNSGTNLVCGSVDSTTQLVTLWVSSNGGASFKSTPVYTNTYAQNYYHIEVDYYQPNNGLATSVYTNNKDIYIVASSDLSSEDETTNIPLLYISANNGNTFSTYSNINLQLQSASSTGNGETVYVASLNGVYRATNYGTTWERCYDGPLISAVAVSGSGAVVYAYSYNSRALLAYSNNTFPPFPAL
jgi:hypothetical protein